MQEQKLIKPVSQGEELPSHELKRFLRQHNLIEQADSELRISQFSNGYSNLTYLLRIEGKEYVLRRPPFAAPKHGHNMGREYKVLSRLHTFFEKTPQALVYSDSPDVLGAPFYIMSRVSGIILTAHEVHRRNCTPADFGMISDTWLDTFVELHAVDYLAAGLESLGRPEGYVTRQVENWGKQYLAAATDQVPAAPKVMAWMHEHQPKQYDRTLIHNDFKYDNVVFADESWQNITAVLDWEMCTLGDPLMDLGTSLGYWTTAEDGDIMKKGLPSPTESPGNPSRTEIVHQYALKSGRSIDHLIFYYAFGLFKIAVIAQQIYYRFKHGHTADPRFANLNMVSASCIESARRAIQKNKID